MFLSFQDIQLPSWFKIQREINHRRKGKLYIPRAGEQVIEWVT